MAAGRRGAGQALIGAGVAVLIATIGALAGSLDDQTGAFFVTTTATVAALGLLVWAYLYRTRNPLPPRRVRTEDGGRRSEVGRREEALNEPELAVAGTLPLADEPVVDEDAGDVEKDVPSIAPLSAESGNPEPELAMAEDDESGDETTDDLPEQPEPAMNGAKAAPFAHHEHKREHELERELDDDWEARSERES